MMDLRVEMSECLIFIFEDLTNKSHVFFSNESSFYVSGMVNKHSCRIWTGNNSVESATNSSKIDVGSAMSNKQIIDH